MLHVVAYDIANDRRLRRVARLCEDYGVRMEKSVFEMDLPPSEFARFWRRLAALVDEEADAVVDYPVVSSAAISTLGRAVRPQSGCFVF